MSDDELPMSMRTAASERYYQTMKASGQLKALHQEPSLMDFTHWRIISNRFPYDSHFAMHDLLLPHRLVPHFKDLSTAERFELDTLLAEYGYVDQLYDGYYVASQSKRSVPMHCHVHLLKFRDKRSEVGL